MATCGPGSCSWTFWSQVLIRNLYDSSSSLKTSKSLLKSLLSICSPFFLQMTYEHCDFFICILSSVCISYYHSDKWIPRQSFGLWYYHSSYSLGVYLGPSSRAELKHQPSSSYFLYAQPLLRWQDSISPVGGLEEARVKWMGHSLSVLQLNARFSSPTLQASVLCCFHYSVFMYGRQHF